MEISDQVIKNNIANLEYGAKELEKLAKKIKNKKNRRTTTEEKNEFAAIIVEASFMLNAFGAASGAFGKAFVDVQNESLKGNPLYYLKEEFIRLHDESLEKERENVDTN